MAPSPVHRRSSFIEPEITPQPDPALLIFIGSTRMDHMRSMKNDVTGLEVADQPLQLPLCFCLPESLCIMR